MYEQTEGKRITSIYSENVKKVREAHGETQKEFAGKIGISPDMVSKIESQLKGLTLDVAWKIAEEYNASLDFLFGRSTDMNDNARHILIKFRDVFKISSDTEDFENDIFSRDKCLSLSIDQHLLDFIKNMEYGEKTKPESMDDKLYTEWLSLIEHNYNEKLRKGEKGKLIKYLLIDSEQLRDLQEKYLMKR